MAQAQLRHAEHYKGVLSAATELYLQGNENVLRGLALFDLERAHIEAGQKWAASPDLRGLGQSEALHDPTGLSEAAVHLCNDYLNAGAYVLALRLHPPERIRWLEDGLKATRQLKNRSMEGNHLGNFGLTYVALGETRKAIEFCEQYRNIAHEIGDWRGEGNALWNMALALDSLGRRAEAIAHAQDSLKIREAIEDP
ncbi:MAG: tetratricopeptide repeat protein [Anaerolineales bacterium]|nr:tetratricopeptide repeat protein [Anaerolineales bacterium]